MFRHVTVTRIMPLGKIMYLEGKISNTNVEVRKLSFQNISDHHLQLAGQRSAAEKRQVTGDKKNNGGAMLN